MRGYHLPPVVRAAGVRVSAAALLSLLLASCGSTVPLASSAPPAGLGGALEAPQSSMGDDVGDTTASEGSAAAAANVGAGSMAAPDSETGERGSFGVTQQVGPAARGGGVRTVAPLRVGVVTTDTGAAVKALGGDTSGTRTSNDGYRALVSALNATGGLSGRKIVPTYVVVEATDSSYQTDSDAYCAALKDAKVEVVISDSASTDFGFADCLARKRISVISSLASDQASLAKALGIYNGFNPSYDRGYGAVVDQLVATGYLSRSSVVGTIRQTCGEIERAYANRVLPRMRAASLAAPVEYTVSCAGGFQDAGAYSAAMQSAVLRFRSAGVDRVLILGVQENLLLQYFAAQADSQRYAPGYALSSSSFPVTLIGSSTFPQAQLPLVRGVGWHPLADTGVDVSNAQQKRCIALAVRGGFSPANIVEVYGLYKGCSNLFLLEAAMNKGAGEATAEALRSGVAALGTSFTSTGILDGQTYYGPGRWDGPRNGAVFAWVQTCSCFRYATSPAVLS